MAEDCKLAISLLEFNTFSSSITLAKIKADMVEDCQDDILLMVTSF